MLSGVCGISPKTWWFIVMLIYIYMLRYIYNYINNQQESGYINRFMGTTGLLYIMITEEIYCENRSLECMKLDIK